MSQKVIIPTLLRRLTDNADAVEVDAATVRDILDRLDERYPGFRARVCEESGELRRFINIYVDGEDVRFLDNLSTSVPERAEPSLGALHGLGREEVERAGHLAVAHHGQGDRRPDPGPARQRRAAAVVQLAQVGDVEQVAQSP